MDQKNLFGYSGETLVLDILASKGIQGVILPDFFDFDIFTNTNLRIEVKAANITLDKDKRCKEGHTREVWQFLNCSKKVKGIKNKQYSYSYQSRLRNCDFYIFLCFRESRLECSYVVLSDFIGNIKQIRFSYVENKYSKYT